MLKRLCALLLSLAMLASLSAAFAEGTVSDTLLVTLGGAEIRENNETLQHYVSSMREQVGDMPTEDDERIIRMYAMHNTMLITMAGQAGGYTEADLDAFSQQARNNWNDIVEYIMMSEFGITDESPEEDKIEARGDAIALLADYYGYVEDEYIRSEELTLPYETFANKLAEDLKKQDPKLAATEQEIRETLDLYVKEDREMLQSLIEEYDDVSNEVSAYEVFGQEWFNAYGEEYEFYYMPEGYRGILYIVLSADEDLMENWTSLTAQLEELIDPEEPAGEETAESIETAMPVTADMVEAARQAVIASRKDAVDEIQEKLHNGASYADLVAEYGENAYLMDEDTLNEGYMIHRDSVLWPAAFTEAAAALENPGDVSDPIVTEDGICILYYLRDIPGGAVELTDEVRENLVSIVEDERVAGATDAWINQWLEDNAVWTEAGEAWKYDQAFVDAYNETLSEDDDLSDLYAGDDAETEVEGEPAL